MLIGFTNAVSPNIDKCELAFIPRQSINYPLALRQHEAYCEILRRFGVAVHKLSVNSSHPDGCFVEDTAIVVDELAILTSMGSPSRHGEGNSIGLELAKYRQISRIEPPAKIEGGDVLIVGKMIFVGLSSRTNLKGAKELTHMLEPYGYKVQPIPIKACLHLKTACTSLDDETFLMNPDWINPDYFKQYKTLFTPIEEPWGETHFALMTAHAYLLTALGQQISCIN